MLNNKKSLFAAILSLLLVLSGCNKMTNPYNQESAEKKLIDYWGDIEVVNEYIVSTGYSPVYIKKSNGYMYADFMDVIIADEKANKAIDRLLKTDCFISISRHSNTIKYLLWSGYAETSCGIAYSINQTDLPDIEYVTELVPLSKDGWYYYIVDYNEWRLSRCTDEDHQH